MRGAAWVLAAVAICFSGAMASGQEAKKGAEKPPTMAQLEARARKLENDLAACRQAVAAYQETTKTDIDAVNIAKQRDVAEEELRKIQKLLSSKDTDLQKAVADLQKMKSGAPAAPAGPPPDETVPLSTYTQIQGSLSQVQGQLSESTTKLQKLQSEKASIQDSLAKLGEEMTSLRATLLAREKSIEGLNEDLSSKKKVISDQILAYEDLTKSFNTTKDTLQKTQGTLNETAKTLADTEKDRQHLLAIVENRLEGALVHLTGAIVPARPLNLRQAVPEKKEGLSGSHKGVIVVNCWVDASGRVKAVRMVQPLAGMGYEVKEINEAYLEAAKRLVFEPATSADGKVRYQVWQGVGFFIDE